MKTILWILIILIIIIVGVFVFSPKKGVENGKIIEQFLQEEINSTILINNMQLTSSKFFHNQSIPSTYTCDGVDISPPLSFSGVPENTQSLALIMEDPDVPVTVRPDGMWDHWIIFNIPPKTSGIEEGQVPEKSVQGITTFGKTSYGGPCPPDREHRYFFRLYALDTILDLPEGSTKKEVIATMQGHILSSAELVGHYKRQ